MLIGTGGTVIIADFKQEQAENCLSYESKFLEHKKLSMGEPVNSITLSPDGKQLLVNISTKNPRMILYDLETCQKLSEYEGHKQPSMVLKPSISRSNLVSIGSEDQVIRIWHKERGELLKELKGHNLPVNAVAFSPKEDNLLVSVSDDMSIRLWGRETLQVELARYLDRPAPREHPRGAVGGGEGKRKPLERRVVPGLRERRLGGRRGERHGLILIKEVFKISLTWV